MTEQDRFFMGRAIELARLGVSMNLGGPFGCVVVKGCEIVGEGSNQVTSSNDPTAHAEVIAIREACKKLGTFQLDGCDVYTSCEPCPMCLGAIYWARPDRIIYACTRSDAAAIGFDDDFIYKELELENAARERPLTTLMRDEALEVFRSWAGKPDKVKY